MLKPAELRSAPHDSFPGFASKLGSRSLLAQRSIRRAVNGFSLIELLMVIAIIAILAGLLLTAVFRAYSKARAMEYGFNGMVQRVDKQLSDFYGELKSYREIPAEDLLRLGAIDKQTAKFLRSPYVKFFPFSSEDPDDKIVLKLKWTGEFETELTKADVTK